MIMLSIVQTQLVDVLTDTKTYQCDDDDDDVDDESDSYADEMYEQSEIPWFANDYRVDYTETEEIDDKK